MAARRVLICGVASFWGQELARKLEQDSGVEYVAGIDTKPPKRDLKHTEFLEADIRSPVMATLVPATGADTVVHAGLVIEPSSRLSTVAAHDANVVGSLQLLNACEKAKKVRTLVLRGSAAIYGAEPAAPSFYPEQAARTGAERSRYQRDLYELESYFETYSRRHPEVACTILRFQPLIGPTVDSPVTRLLSLPVVPTPMGFDPRIQLVHQDDAIDALYMAVKKSIRGPINIAGEGSISLMRMLRLAGKVTVPVVPPLLYRALRAARVFGVKGLGSDFNKVLRYGRGVDVGRMLDELGFKPHYSTVDAVADYIEKSGSRRVVSSLKEATIGAG